MSGQPITRLRFELSVFWRQFWSITDRGELIFDGVLHTLKLLNMAY